LTRSLLVHGVKKPSLNFVNESLVELSYPPSCRGHGDSVPKLSEKIQYSQTDSIVEDIPALVEGVRKITGSPPRFYVTHSWGGVLLNSYFARFPDQVHVTQAVVNVGTKRRVMAQNLEVSLKVKLGWNILAPVLGRVFGYLPGRQLKFGSDDDGALWQRQSVEWVKPLPWVDPEDGFDYGEACKKVSLPPTLYLAAERDYSLGHKDDVRRFMEESHPSGKNCELRLLSKKTGNLHDYDHINMLVHRDCSGDHFTSLVLPWLRSSHSGQPR